MNAEWKRPPLVIDNHGHVGKFEPGDIVDGFDPALSLGGSHEDFLALMDAAGVDAAVLHTLRPWANQYHRRIIAQHPGRFISVCKIDETVAHTAQAVERVRMYVQDWGFKGLYYDPWPPVGTEAAEGFHGPAYAPLWELVQRLDVPVCFVSYRQNFATLWPALLKLLERRPRLRVVIVHGLYPAMLLQAGGKVVIPDDALRLVKGFDVSLDLLAGHGQDRYGPQDQIIRALYDAFGPAKLLWGSEFTKVSDPTARQYACQLHYLENRCRFLTADDLRLILGANAQRVYGLGT